MNHLTLGLVSTSIVAALAFTGTLATNRSPFDGVDSRVKDEALTVKAKKALTGGEPQSGGEREQGKVENSSAPARKEVRQNLTATGPEVTLQSYCFTADGTGHLDCFERERAQCTEPGSQLVVRAEVIDDKDKFGVDRFGTPFCSTVPEPAAPATPAADGEPEAPPMPVVTLADFQQLNITPSTLKADSGGFGLRNAHTNFYASADAQTLKVEMLGQDVAIQAVPVQWTYTYGDGSAPKALSHPGGPQKEFNQKLPTTHTYAETGQFTVNLTTSFRGQYSVNGGPWLPIPGTAQVPSEPVTADIWRSKTRNVAEDCNRNPRGWACGDPFVED